MAVPNMAGAGAGVLVKSAHRDGRRCSQAAQVGVVEHCDRQLLQAGDALQRPHQRFCIRQRRPAARLVQLHAEAAARRET